LRETNAGYAGKSPIAQALGEDFHKLHEAVRMHYAEPTTEASGIMVEVHVKSIIKPLALLSYRLFHAPVPHSGRDVEMSLLNRIDDSGTMYWVRTFFKNASFPETITFPSHMVRSGDHRIIEITRYGVGGESDLSVDREGSLVYDLRRYVVRVPFLGLIMRFPTWFSPFGGGRTREIGEAENSFRVDFEMTHPIFGRTVGYAGKCRIKSPS
jgi:hypothetical protein